MNIGDEFTDDKQTYRFEPLSTDNKNIWLEAALRCDYAPLNALDGSLIDAQLKDDRAARIIIHESKSGKPAGRRAGASRTPQSRAIAVAGVLRGQDGAFADQAHVTAPEIRRVAPARLTI